MAIARWYEASLTVLHVFTNVPNLEASGVPVNDPDHKLLIDRMQAFAGAAPIEVPVTFVARCVPDVSGEILAQAEVADLVVIGSHGRSGFDRFGLGSVTEKVVRKSSRPVMVVPPHAPDAGGSGLNHAVQPRILCATDFSDASLGAVDYAISIAKETRGELTLFHSIEVPPELQEPVPVSTEFNIDQCHAAAEAACLRRLRELVPPSVRRTCQVKTVVTEGLAHRQLLYLSVEQPTDLIVMGVRGRGAIDLLLFGSNTAHVIRSATCPVMIVPHPRANPVLASHAEAVPA